MTHPPTTTYLFAGGGTGGHIFPALAIAEELATRDPGARFSWLVSDRAIDAKILSERDRPYEALPAKPFVTSPAGLLRFATSWGPSVRAARAHLQAARAHGDVRLIAMGGFVCPPAVRAARAEGVPVALVNLDAVPGRANRWVAKRAARVITACPAAGHAWDPVGPIVRAEALPPGDARACRSALGLDPERPTLFVSGGSQGARSVNALVRAFVEAHADALRAGGWQILHLTGDRSETDTAAACERAGVPARTLAFLGSIGNAWGAADLAIARSGAGSVAEAWASRTPTVFLPFPHHADDHQRLNADALVRAGGAMICTDRVEPDRNMTDHAQTVLALLADADRRAVMHDSLATLGPSDGAARAADALLGAW